VIAIAASKHSYVLIRTAKVLAQAAQSPTRRNRAALGTKLAGKVFAVEDPRGAQWDQDDGETPFAGDASGIDCRRLVFSWADRGAPTQGRMMPLLPKDAATTARS
jgi:hypothetical protein